MKKFFDKNSVWFGMFVGFIVPIVFFFVFDFIVKLLSGIFTYGITLVQDLNVLLIATFMNIIVFRKYLKSKEYEMTGRGVLVITFLLTVVYFIFKFFVIK